MCPVLLEVQPLTADLLMLLKKRKKKPLQKTNEVNLHMHTRSS